MNARYDDEEDRKNKDKPKKTKQVITGKGDKL